MTNFNFTIEQSKLHEKIFISSLREYMQKYKVQTYNTSVKAGSQRSVNIIGGFEVQKHDIYQETDNPFMFERKFPLANILGIYSGSITVENQKSFQKNIDNENISFYQYLLKGEIAFKPKKIISIFIFVIGLVFAIGTDFSTSTIISFAIILLIWAIIVRIIGKLNTQKIIKMITNIFSKYQTENN